jgi:small-conductance mechanosensitive channel
LNEPSKTSLHFDTLALLAVQPDGSLNVAKLTDLVRLFRPDRDGNLSLLDFAKCIDSCYKELRLLRASVASSSRIDKAFERILNIFFYFIVGIIVLLILGIDPLLLFASVSGFVLAFAFMLRR